MREAAPRITVGSLLLAAALLCVAAGNASAQGPSWHENRVSAGTMFELSKLEAPTSMQQSEEKSPALAGVLSLLIPGLGSYYAGNSGHGTRHLVIWGVSFGVFVWGAAETSSDVIDGVFTGEDNIHPALWIGAAALTVNTIWAIVTAVTDATDYNETLSIGPLDFAPAVTAAPASNHFAFTGKRHGPPGMNLRLARLTF